MKFTIILLMSYALAGPEKKLPAGSIRIAIGDIEWQVPIEKNQIISSQREAEKVADSLRSRLNTALFKSRRFKVIERDQLPQIVKELQFGAYSGLAKDTPELGKLEGLDYMVLGAISQFSTDEHAKGWGRMAGKSEKTMQMVVDLRIIDVKSGEYKFADFVNSWVYLGKQKNIGILRKGGILKKLGKVIGDEEVSEALNDAAYLTEDLDLGELGEQKGLNSQADVMLRETARNLIKILVSSVYPIKVVKVGDRGIMLNYGKGVLQTGDRLDVYEEDEITDPDSGVILGVEKILIARIDVTDTHVGISNARTADPVNRGRIRPGMVCKHVSETIEERMAREKKKKKKGR